MIYEFYNIKPAENCIEQIGITRAFNIGMSKYMSRIANMFDDDNLKLSPIIKTNLKRLKNNDCFLVGVRAKNDLFLIGIHVSDGKDGPNEIGSEYKDKLITLYSDFQKEILN